MQWGGRGRRPPQHLLAGGQRRLLPACLRRGLAAAASRWARPIPWWQVHLAWHPLFQVDGMSLPGVGRGCSLSDAGAWLVADLFEDERFILVHVLRMLLTLHQRACDRAADYQQRFSAGANPIQLMLPSPAGAPTVAGAPVAGQMEPGSGQVCGWFCCSRCVALGLKNSKLMQPDVVSRISRNSRGAALCCWPLVLGVRCRSGRSLGNLSCCC